MIFPFILCGNAFTKVWQKWKQMNYRVSTISAILKLTKGVMGFYGFGSSVKVVQWMIPGLTCLHAHVLDLILAFLIRSLCGCTRTHDNVPMRLVPHNTYCAA